MSLEIGRQGCFRGNSLFPLHRFSTTWMTETGSEPALRSRASRAAARELELPLSRGKSTRTSSPACAPNLMRYSPCTC